MLVDDRRPRLDQMFQELNHDSPLLGRAGHESAIPMPIVDQMGQQNAAIPAVIIVRLGKGKPCESREVVGKPLRSRKADRVVGRTAHVLNAERLKVPRTQQFIVFRALVAMGMVREMHRAAARLESLLNPLENVGVGLHGALERVSASTLGRDTGAWA